MKNFKTYIGEASQQYSDLFSSELVEKFRTTTRGSGSAMTLWTRCRLGEFELVKRIGLELKQILHAEQEYEFLIDPAAEVAYRYSTRLSQVIEKKSKGMILHFLTFETEIRRDSDAELSARARSVMVFREQEINA